MNNFCLSKTPQRVKKKIYIMKKQFYLNYITFINKFKICNPIEKKYIY